MTKPTKASSGTGTGTSTNNGVSSAPPLEQQFATLSTDVHELCTQMDKRISAQDQRIITLVTEANHAMMKQLLVKLEKKQESVLLPPVQHQLPNFHSPSHLSPSGNKQPPPRHSNTRFHDFRPNKQLVIDPYLESDNICHDEDRRHYEMAPKWHPSQSRMEQI
jgi:hypothetical protein